MIVECLVTPAIAEELLQNGFAMIRGAFDGGKAVSLRQLYDDDALFRSRIVMERHSFGKGEYKYFANPLPPRIQALREGLYEQLLPTANEWMRRLGRPVSFPATHQAFLHECLAGEQSRPTTLLLRYRAGDYNRLHQDLYGPVAFPLQATIYLSRPAEEYGGGEVVLAEQRPRSQTRVHVLSPDQGDMLVFPASAAPLAGANGVYRGTFVTACRRWRGASATPSASCYTTRSEPGALLGKSKSAARRASYERARSIFAFLGCRHRVTGVVRRPREPVRLPTAANGCTRSQDEAEMRY